jgi:hypothetical protein
MTVQQAFAKNTDGTEMGESATDKISFYGATPVVQRATAATHTTTAVVTSASFGTLQVAQIQEIQNTLIALGLWAA